MRSDDVTFTTSMSVQELGRALQNALAAAKASSIEPVQSSSGALSGFDDRADIEIVAQGQSLLGGAWVVQAYVVDRGSEREVQLVALGDGGFTRAMSGARNSVSLGGSVKKRDQIAASLR